MILFIRVCGAKKVAHIDAGLRQNLAKLRKINSLESQQSAIEIVKITDGSFSYVRFS